MDTTNSTAAPAVDRSPMGFDGHVGIFILASGLAYLVLVLFFGFLHLSTVGVGFIALCLGLTANAIVLAVDVFLD